MKLVNKMINSQDLKHLTYVKNTNPPIFYKIETNNYFAESIFSNYPINKELSDCDWQITGRYGGAYRDLYITVISKYIQKEEIPDEIYNFEVYVNYQNDDVIAIDVVEDISTNQQFSNSITLKLTSDEKYNKQILEAILRIVKS